VELNTLKAFCSIVECGSISKASKKLFVSQPSLSVSIHNLEKQYHAVLLERTNRGVRPTEAGMVVYQHAQRMLSISDCIERELDQSRTEKLVLTVGASSTIGNHALPCTLYNFKEKFPQYHIEMKITHSDLIIDHLVNKRVDIGLIEGPLSDEVRASLVKEKIKTKLIASGELILVVPNNEFWKNVNHVSLGEDFLKLPFILREKGSGIRATLEMTLAASGLTIADLQVALVLESTNAIISAVASGRGVAFLPKMTVRKELNYKILKEITVRDMAIKHEITTLHYPEDEKKPLQNLFLTFLHSKERGFC
jgi:LysR family transcriptional regulator, transcriptional activator of the cysJI operon